MPETNKHAENSVSLNSTLGCLIFANYIAIGGLRSTNLLISKIHLKQCVTWGTKNVPSKPLAFPSIGEIRSAENKGKILDQILQFANDRGSAIFPHSNTFFDFY